MCEVMVNRVRVLGVLFWDEKGSRQDYWILTKKEEALDDLLGKLRFGIVCCLTTRKELCKLCVLGFNRVNVGLFYLFPHINTDYGSCFFLFGQWGFWSWESRKGSKGESNRFIARRSYDVEG